MSRVVAQISISLDGYGAGPGQSLEEPLGTGGERLHEWAFATEDWRASHGYSGGEASVDSEIIGAMHEGIGAVVMGRGMFGGGPGEWQGDWKGWWGDDPPYHMPVYVLTHHPREPVEMEGGTTFHFVTDGVEAALELARESAGDEDVLVAGGPGAIDQFLKAGLVDELFLHIVPILLGAGTRLLADAGDPELRPVEVIASPGVTHIRYAVG